MAVLALTTLERLKAYAQIKADARADADAVLASMILSVSQKFEQYCSRLFAVEERIETGTLQCGTFLMSHVPVQSIAQVRYSQSGRRSELIGLSESDYQIGADGWSVDVFDVIPGGMIEVTYTGGLADDTDAVISDHPALEDACKMQCTSLWKRHTIPDRSGMTLGTGDTSWTAEYGLLKDVKSILDQNYNTRHRFL